MIGRLGAAYWERGYNAVSLLFVREEGKGGSEFQYPPFYGAPLPEYHGQKGEEVTNFIREMGL